MTEQTSTATCKYPGCEATPERAAGPGRPPEYCADPGHNKVTAWRERKRLADAERGVATTDADTEAAGDDGAGARRRDTARDARDG